MHTHTQGTVGSVALPTKSRHKNKFDLEHDAIPTLYLAKIQQKITFDRPLEQSNDIIHL